MKPNNGKAFLLDRANISMKDMCSRNLHGEVQACIIHGKHVSVIVSTWCEDFFSNSINGIFHVYARLQFEIDRGECVRYLCGIVIILGDETVLHFHIL